MKKGWKPTIDVEQLELKVGPTATNDMSGDTGIIAEDGKMLLFEACGKPDYKYVTLGECIANSQALAERLVRVWNYWIGVSLEDIPEVREEN